MEAEVFNEEAFETVGIHGIMQWNFNIPGGHPSLNPGRRELERCPLTYFLDCLSREKSDMFTATWDPVLEDGVRFWFDGINKPDGGLAVCGRAFGRYPFAPHVANGRQGDGEIWYSTRNFLKGSTEGF